jgi:hypothetical protein
MAVENLVTGEEEVLTFSADRYAIAGWVPDDVRTSQVIGLFVMSDASYRLADKLGNEFRFDAAGNLTDEIFGPERHMHLEYARPEAASERSPYARHRLVPVGSERRDVQSASLPVELRLADPDAGEGPKFSLDSDGQVVRYVATSEAPYEDLAALSDGSFLLTDTAGRETRFDPEGRFAAERFVAPEPLVARLSDGASSVALEYRVASSGVWRVVRVRLTQGGEDPALQLAYEYDETGRLARVVGQPDETVQAAPAQVAWR